MTNVVALRPRARPAPIVRRRRGAFGLDEARAPDPSRVERSVLAWLAANLPAVAALPIRPSPACGDDAFARLLALLLPHGRVAVLRIAGRPAAAVDALVEACRATRTPVATVRGTQEVRAFLRRLGFEPEGE